MKKTILLSMMTILTGCGLLEKKEDAEINGEADAIGEGGVQLIINVPDRSLLTTQGQDPTQIIDGYYLKLWPGGEGCDNQNLKESNGFYPVDNAFRVIVQPNCDYGVLLALGSRQVFDPQDLPEDDSSDGAEAGDESGDTDEETPAETTLVTYEQHIKPLLTDNCIGCHQPGGQRGQTDLTEFDTVFSFRNAIVNRVSTGSMPPSGSLADAPIAVFNQWADDGFPRGEVAEEDETVRIILRDVSGARGSAETELVILDDDRP